MTSFYVDQNFENEMEQEQKDRQKETRKIYKKIESISTYEGLCTYIREEKNSLHNLTNLLGLSEENFKRIVSMIRRKNGERFASEWSINETRRKMMGNEFYMREICGLLVGKRDYSRYIPRFILNQLLIDTRKLKVFSSSNVLPEMIKNAFKGKYSTEVGRQIENLVEDVIKKHVHDQYCCRQKVFERNIDFVIPDLEKPKILIEVSYMVTTGSGQSTKRDTMINVAKRINDKNVYQDDNMIFVNVIDGAGWIARQRDLERIHKASDYMLNLQNLEMLGEILDYYCN